MPGFSNAELQSMLGKGVCFDDPAPVFGKYASSQVEASPQLTSETNEAETLWKRSPALNCCGRER